jgi:hypothetical protein
MECPHCHEKISGKVCPSCDNEIPADSLFCMKCGAELKADEADIQEEDEFDLENRVLCSDGSCTGIIIDGKCTECGKPFSNEG